MLAAIGAARNYILLEMYLVESGAVASSIIQALLDAAERGVTIHIIFDGFGTRNLNDADRARLKHPAIEIAFYHPVRLWPLRRLFVRDHRKLLLVDGRVGFTGGMGFSDGITTDTDEPIPWHDMVVQFTGTVINDWQQLFTLQWQRITSVELSLPEPRPESDATDSSRLVSSQPARINPIYGHLRQRARFTNQRLWVATAYFLPSWRLRRVMRTVADRDVDVRLLLPGRITDNPAVRYASQGFYLALLKAGIRIYEYQPTFMHTKLALVDDWVSLGSSNFDRWSIARNLEANLEIDNPEFAAHVAALFEKDFADSVEITLDDWTHRPSGQRWRERIWGMIEEWLDRR
jgi:phosphatidylserine/phosphatidylglycerophosphate/cardiolipin synthase-like enzyme